MKKTSLILLFSTLPFFLSISQVEAVPDIRGQYSGSYTIVVSNCTDSDSDGTYTAALSMDITTQSGSTFNGSATGTLNYFGMTATENILLSGTITETGYISGTTSHIFLGTGGEGTFIGQLSGDTLTIENTGHDTYGETCSYVRTMSATRGDLLSANFSVNTKSGNIPLSVNFTDESVGNIISWEWSFGDGSTSALQNPSYIYANEGIYNVSLTVSGLNGSDTKTKSYYIYAGIPGKNRISPSHWDGMESASDHFGVSVSISGDHAIVGTEEGCAYIFDRNGSVWNQVAKLTASDGWLSKSVSVSGDYAIVGSEMDDENGFNAGAAYVFKKTDTGWNQAAKLITNEGGINAYFGRSVFISGNYVIVGAVHDYAAYIFERNGSTWEQITRLTANDGESVGSFGESVSIFGDYAIVGASKDNANGHWSGSAFIFEKNSGTWNQVAKFTANDYRSYEQFGRSVFIYKDYAIVGAVGDDDNGNYAGAAYVFEKTDSGWNQAAKLTASDGESGEYFGMSVAISENHEIVEAFLDYEKGIIIGSSYYVFERNGSVWNQVDKLREVASSGPVSISGNYAIAGSSGTGTAYIFDLGVLYDDQIDSDAWERISGRVGKNGTPLCAMVLANGQYMFTCKTGDDFGKYELDVPLDANGEITIQAFVSGLAPFRQTTDESDLTIDIGMQPVAPESKLPVVTTDVQSDLSTPIGWERITGTVTHDGEPLCAMVLANGQYMFSLRDQQWCFTI